MPQRIQKIISDQGEIFRNVLGYPQDIDLETVMSTFKVQSNVSAGDTSMQ